MELILFRGRPGVGKTTLSDAFSVERNLPILRKDDLYDTISYCVEDHQTRNKICYDSLYSIIQGNINSDCKFIVDFSFQKHEDFLTIRNWCKQNNVLLKSVLVTCSDETLWEQRFDKRPRNGRPSQYQPNFKDMKKSYGSFEIVPESDERVVDTVNSMENLLIQLKDL